jgi:N-acetyltransferase
VESPVLAGAAVRLEPLRREHATELWPSAREVGLWDYMVARVDSKEDLDAWIQARINGRDAGTAIPFLLRDGAGAAAGSTSIFDIKHPTMEVGHTWIGKPWRRTALNTEAKLLVLGHCFEGLGAIRVQLKCDERNLASRKAIERLGAVYEGTIRNQLVLHDGRKRQARVYSILDDEWPRVREGLRLRLAR